MANEKQKSNAIVERVRVNVPPRSAGSSSSPSRLVPSSQLNGESQCCFAPQAVRNWTNFKRSGPPARVMYYRDGSWVDFPSEVFEELRSGFLGGKAVIEAVMEGILYLFDFYRMVQTELKTGDRRSIAWIDADGQCFFPETFEQFGELCGNRKKAEIEVAAPEELPIENQKIEIEITIKQNSESKKRKREGKEIVGAEEDEMEVSSTNRQGQQKQPRITTVVEKPKWPKSRSLNVEERAYPIVKHLFESGIANVEPGAMITSIYQCVRPGPLDKARSDVFHKQAEMTKVSRGESNMQFAWFGTSAKCVASIMAHGFGMPTVVPDSESHGVGVYLSPARSPHLSTMRSEEDDYGEKHLILCRVILGKCEQVEAGSKQLYPSSVDYDTGVDNIDNPKWFVVWTSNMNTHILPDCVVSYKCSNRLPGPLNGSPLMEMLPDGSGLIKKVVSKLWNCLPQSRHKMQALCSIYKDGKVGNDVFLKELRSIVGDQTLLSTLREVRG